MSSSSSITIFFVVVVFHWPDWTTSVFSLRNNGDGDDDDGGSDFPPIWGHSLLATGDERSLDPTHYRSLTNCMLFGLTTTTTTKLNIQLKRIRLCLSFFFVFQMEHNCCHFRFLFSLNFHTLAISSCYAHNTVGECGSSSALRHLLRVFLYFT